VRELIPKRRSYFQGDSYTVKSDQVHKLSGLVDHAVTLAVETPLVRHFSEAFYQESGEPRVFYDFAGLHSQLAAEMLAARRLIEPPGRGCEARQQVGAKHRT
jgi:hypothetical protein